MISAIAGAYWSKGVNKIDMNNSQSYDLTAFAPVSFDMTAFMFVVGSRVICANRIPDKSS